MTHIYIPVLRKYFKIRRSALKQTKNQEWVSIPWWILLRGEGGTPPPAVFGESWPLVPNGFGNTYTLGAHIQQEITMWTKELHTTTTPKWVHLRNDTALEVNNEEL